MNADQYCPSNPDPAPLTYARVFSTIAYHMPTYQADIDIVEWLISHYSEWVVFPRRARPELNARTRLSAAPLSVGGSMQVNFDDLFAPASSLRKEEAAPRMDERNGHKLFKIAINRVTLNGIFSVVEECWGKVS